MLTCTTALCSGVTLWLSGTFSGSQREREMGVVQYLIIQCSGPHPVKSSAHLHGGLVQRRHLVAVWGVHISAGCKQGRGDLVASLHVPISISATCLAVRLHDNLVQLSACQTSPVVCQASPTQLAVQSQLQRGLLQHHRPTQALHPDVLAIKCASHYYCSQMRVVHQVSMPLIMRRARLQCGKVQGSAAACIARADGSALPQQLPRHVQAASTPASAQV